MFTGKDHSVLYQDKFFVKLLIQFRVLNLELRIILMLCKCALYRKLKQLETSVKRITTVGFRGLVTSTGKL